MNAVSFFWLLIVVLKLISPVHANWITGNLCWSMPCMNGGSCFGSAYTYLCVCPINYDGALCEKRLGICQENPCGNRGLCIEKSLTSFECRCYYDYIGPTCEEYVKNNDRKIWSSLLPIHTRILFNMLQEAYRVKAKAVSAPENGVIDFINLLLTSTTSTTTTTTTTAPVETIVTTDQSETTEREVIIQAHDIQLEKIFTDQNTAFTEQSSHFDNVITDEIEENITTRPTEQIEFDSFDTTDNQEMVNIVTSTSIPWSYDDNNTITTQVIIEEEIDSTESIVVTTTQPIDLTSSNIDDGDDDDYEIYSSDQTTTLPISTSVLPSSLATTIHHAHSQLLSKICQQIFSHISPNASLSSNSSSVLHNNNNTADVLLSWLNKHLNSTKITTRTSPIPSFIINEPQSSSSGPLQRIDMDDVLHQMDTYIDDESAHR